MRLQAKTALITGGASGIGRATALLFAREGAAVAIADLNKTAGNSLVDEVRNNGGRALFTPVDVSQAADCHRMVEHTVHEFGSIHILFNNAGIIRRATVTELSEEDWDRVMDVNVKSMFLMSREVIPIMTKAGGGSIMNIASGRGLSAAAKAAVHRAARAEVGVATNEIDWDQRHQEA